MSTLNSCMGARRHGHEGALAHPRPGNVVNCFRALVVTAKRSVDESFTCTHYFYNLSSASQAFAPRPHRDSIPGPHWETFVPRPLICPPLEKSCRRPWTRTHLTTHQSAGASFQHITDVHSTVNVVLVYVTQMLATTQYTHYVHELPSFTAAISLSSF